MHNKAPRLGKAEIACIFYLWLWLKELKLSSWGCELSLGPIEDKVVVKKAAAESWTTKFQGRGSFNANKSERKSLLDDLIPIFALY